MKFLQNLLLIFLLLVYSASQASQPISLDFNAIPVRDVLQLLAQFDHKNLIISDSVHGEITLHLENLPWQQALELILQEQGL